MELSGGRTININQVVSVSKDLTSIMMSNDDYIAVTEKEGTLIRNILFSIFSSIKL